jgi:single-strand DNA-binding protein
MARSINQVFLLGNLTRNPEIRQTPTGQTVATFPLALNRSYKDASDTWQEATDYVDVVAWGNLAQQVHEHLSMGKRALVEGRIQSRAWEKDGVKHNKVEVLANNVTFFNGNDQE